jgi:hypothetical protein
MKRPGKCVGKRKYAHYSTACQMAKWKLLNEHIELGVYECPTCLDFHLTSKYCNLKHLHKRWQKTPALPREEIKKQRKREMRKVKKQRKKLLAQNNPPIVKVKPKVKWGGDVDAVLSPYQVHKSLWQKLLDAILQK